MANSSINLQPLLFESDVEGESMGGGGGEVGGGKRTTVGWIRGKRLDRERRN